LSRSGFTLIEAALVTTIISFGVLAMLQLLAVGTVSNNDGAEMSTAINLAKSVREMMIGMSIADPQTPTHWGSEAGENLATYDDIDDFDGKTYSPPIDARRISIAALPDWSQTIPRADRRSQSADHHGPQWHHGRCTASRVTVKTTTPKGHQLQLGRL
jgi:type II secretory pathway pseudopilin PulG